MFHIEDKYYIDENLIVYKKYNFRYNGKRIRRGKNKEWFDLTLEELKEFCKENDEVIDIENKCYYKKQKIYFYDGNNFYPEVSLGKHPKDMHRIVAEIFIPNPENKKYVNHKNGNKNDYSIENLEWVTCQENSKHAIETKLIDINSRKKKIYIYKTTGEFVKEVLGSEEAYNITGCSKSMIANILKGVRKSSNGFTFRREKIEIKPFLPKKAKRKVLVYKVNGEFVGEFESVSKARKELNIFNIFKCLSGEYKQVNGYIVKYKEE